jgi:hypothetical protein
MRFIVFALLAGVSVAAAAGSMDINLSNHTIEAQYATSAGSAQMSLGGLYNDDNKNWFAQVGLLASGETETGGSRFDAGLGGKLYAVHVAGKDLLALGLGGQLRWFPGNRSFGVGGYAFYAPSVVTFVDGEKFSDLGLRAEIEVVKNSTLYAGYRWVKAELSNHTSSYVDKGGFVGIRIDF